MNCFGRNTSKHCCYINGKPCKFLEENTVPGERWSCQLWRETGSWQAAIDDPRYKSGKPSESPGKYFEGFQYTNCRDYQCETCAAFERGDIDQAELDRRLKEYDDAV